MNINKIKQSLSLGLPLFFLTHPVYAAKDWGDCVKQEAATISCLEPLFENVATAVTSFVGVVLFIVLIVSGFTYLTAGADPKKMEKAKGSLSGALLGLVIVALAYLIIQFISEFTGVNSIKNFNVDINDNSNSNQNTNQMRQAND